MRVKIVLRVLTSMVLLGDLYLLTGITGRQPQDFRKPGLGILITT